MQDKVSNFKCLLKSPACLRLGTMSSASLTCYRCLCAFTGVLPKRKMTKLTYSILAVIGVGLLLIGMYRLSEFSRRPLKIGFLTGIVLPRFSLIPWWIFSQLTILRCPWIVDVYCLYILFTYTVYICYIKSCFDKYTRFRKIATHTRTHTHRQREREREREI